MYCDANDLYGWTLYLYFLLDFKWHKASAVNWTKLLHNFETNMLEDNSKYLKKVHHYYSYLT